LRFAEAAVSLAHRSRTNMNHDVLPPIRYRTRQGILPLPVAVLTVIFAPGCDQSSKPGPVPAATATATASATVAASQAPSAAPPLASSPPPNAQDWADCFPPPFEWGLQGTRLLGVALGSAFRNVVDVKNEFPLPGKGKDRVGARVRGKLRCATTGAKLAADARIVDAALDPGAPDRWLYDVEILTPGPGEGTWIKACTDRALALPGTWDDKGNHQAREGVFAFACTDAAAAKCVQSWGYQPPDELHAACTRMARADYCGEDKSHTEDGTLVDVWDTAGISQHAAADKRLPSARFEAAWTSRGALCIDHVRYEKTHNPPCAAALPRCNAEGVAKALADSGAAKLVFNDSCYPDAQQCGAVKK
jgi:hypothetical protein